MGGESRGSRGSRESLRGQTGGRAVGRGAILSPLAACECGGTRAAATPRGAFVVRHGGGLGPLPLAHFVNRTGPGGRQPASDRGMLAWSYDSMVPCYRLARGEREVLRSSDKRCIVITDPEVPLYARRSARTRASPPCARTQAHINTR
jgi:hypothetical protein